MKKKLKEITVKELSAQLTKLKLTPSKLEFAKAVFRACIQGVLEDRFKCKVDI